MFFVFSSSYVGKRSLPNLSTSPETVVATENTKLTVKSPDGGTRRHCRRRRHNQP
ncbi:hypothetical protein LINGRAHAP2_LOCUS31396 [Linum grandiflorum]